MDALRRFVWRIADCVGDFLDEAQFRAALAWRVLTGRVPVEERHRHLYSGSPILLECSDWTDGRLLFSVLVWPAEGDSQLQAHLNHKARAKQILNGFNQACSDRAWSVQWLADYGLEWDPQREVWTASDDFSYEPPAGRDGEDAA